MDANGAVDLFRAALGGAEDRIELVECALLIAQAEYPQLDRAEYRQRLDEMGGEAAAALTGSALTRIEQLNELMFQRWGFRGNREEYYDPRNSFLNDVLDRRTGIPITLAVVYIEVARRAGFDLAGVSMPGHFLVGCANRSDVYVDVFSEGVLLTREDCAARLHELQPDAAFRPEFLALVGAAQILTRMLNNLLEIYLDQSRYPKALGVLDFIFCLAPEDPFWLRRRALVHYNLKSYSKAIADLEAYLESTPAGPEHDEVMQHIAALQHLRGLVN